MNLSKTIVLIILITFIFSFTLIAENIKEPEKLSIMHSISSHDILDYVKELCKDKYTGRLTGTKGYNLSAEWLIAKLKNWNLKPADNSNSYLQKFPNPYTLVLPGSKLTLHIPVKKGKELLKNYIYQNDFIPGSTSDSGEITAEIVYVGYGISAPELRYDDYKGIDVKGKIVLVDREVPVSPYKNPEKFKRWRPYSFHQYKVKNAKQHGAVGMLYNYHIVNPNCLWQKGFLLSYIGKNVMNDIFVDAKFSHKQITNKIKKKLKPYSFRTKKTITIKNLTEHHIDGVAANILAMVEGSDEKLKNEVIILSAHLDHVGMNHEMMPGANDNASGVAVLMGVAKALNKLKVKPKRTILFAFLGAEEQGVKGSEYFLKNIPDLIRKPVITINLDGVGRGDTIIGIAGKRFPEIWKYFEDENRKYIHRKIKATEYANIARPRLDASHFISNNIPTVSFYCSGMDLDFDIYHKTLDKPELLTPEIMEDLSKLIFLTVLKLAN